MAVSLAEAFQLVSDAATVLMPPPEMSGSEWADTYRILSREDSAAPGNWSTDARPYQKEIMDVACDAVTQLVTVKGCSQWGKTQISLNIIGCFVHLDPGPIMVVQPTISACEKWSKTRLTPMIRDCEVLTGLFTEQKSRDASNTILEKKFPGGVLVGVGANAPAGLAAQPIRILIMDEVDRFGDSAGTEGDPEKLAEARTVDFRLQKKIYRCSTPTILGASKIEDSWQKSDQREWWVTCPHCGHEQTLTFWQIIWQDNDPETAIYACKGAGCEITEPQLRRAARAGRWIATKAQVKGHAGFNVPGALVKPMAELAKGYLEAKANGSRELQVFYNTQLGELWNLHLGEEEKTEGMLRRARKSPYLAGEVPVGIGFLVAGIDVQGDRVEAVVRGVGAAGTRWTICHRVITGNPMLNEMWDRLEAFLGDCWVTPSGKEIRIRKICIDEGFHSKQVKAFAKRPGLRGRLSMVKGASRRQQKWCLPSKKIRNLFTIDTISIKDNIYEGLKIDDETIPGYQWFPRDSTQSYFDQLLSNKRDPKTHLYKASIDGAPEEVLDCHVYCEAAVDLFSPRKGEIEEMAAFYAPPAGKSGGTLELPEIEEEPEIAEETVDIPEDTPVPPAPPQKLEEPPRAARRQMPTRRPQISRRKPLMGW